MKIEFSSQNDEDESYQIKFFVSEFTEKKSINEALIIVNAFAGDFSLDPELTSDDIAELLANAKSEGVPDFIIEMDDEGLDYLL